MGYSDSFSQSEDPCDNGDVVTFLHRAGERYKEHLELLRRQRIEEERRIGPGTPRVSPFANEWSSQTTRKSEAVENRLHRLHQRRQEKIESFREKSMMERAAKEMEDMQQQLHLTEMGKGHTHRDPIEVTERFLQDHRKNMKRLTEESIKRELQAMQPGPQITALAATQHTAERKKGMPIEDHLMDVEKQRRQRLYDAVEKQKEPTHTFHPHITRRAQEAASGRVVDRLYQVSRTAPVYDETYERECTFRPRTNHMFEYDDPLADVPVYDRLHDGSRTLALTEEREVHRDPVLAMTFKPRISKKSEEIIKEKRQKLGTPAGRSPTSRLSEHNTQSSASIDEADENCTFKPTVNRRSVALWHKTIKGVMETSSTTLASKGEKKLTPQELLWEKKAAEKERFLKNLSRDIAERELEECSFAPNASSRVTGQDNVHIQRPDEFAERENMWVLHRERTVEQLKHDLEQRSLEECTFHPVVHDEIPVVSASVPNAVGFEQHLRRQQEARMRRAEEERRKSAGPTTRSRSSGPTIPKPFVLGRERERLRIAKESDSISALRPPLTFDEWSHMRRELDDEPDHFYDSGARPPRNSNHRSEDDTSFFVRRPSNRGEHHSARGAQRSSATPVEFVMNHHHAIMKSLEGTRRR